MDEKISLLRSVHFFSKLSPGDCRIIAGFSGLHSYAKGCPVFKKGDPGESLYIVSSGSVIVSRHDEDGNESLLGRYTPNTCFGEMGLLSREPREADAHADEDTTLLRFPENEGDLEILIRTDPRIAAALLHHFLIDIASRIRETNRIIKENSPWIRELQKQVYIDKLTGLYNQVYLNENLGKMLAKAPLTLFTMKPDNFKQINDTFGHETGDRVLELIAECLREKLPDSYIPVRYQGNQMSIIMPGVDYERSMPEAKKIKSHLNGLDLSPATGDPSVRLSVSIGLAVYPLHGRDPETLIGNSHGLPMQGRNLGGDRILYPEIEVENA